MLGMVSVKISAVSQSEIIRNYAKRPCQLQIFCLGEQASLLFPLLAAHIIHFWSFTSWFKSLAKPKELGLFSDLNKEV